MVHGIKFACEEPDSPENFPRNMFIWRSNILGSSGKGHEYFLKYLLGTQNGVMNDENGPDGIRPKEVKWEKNAPEGKLDLVVTLDFRMSSTCLPRRTVRSWCDRLRNCSAQVSASSYRGSASA